MSAVVSANSSVRCPVAGVPDSRVPGYPGDAAIHVYVILKKRVAGHGYKEYIYI